jgi:large subunit ribosomal protein L1
MPNPKTETVSPNIANAIKEIKAGKVEYRNDKAGNLHIVAGKASFETEKLVENIKTIIDQVVKIRPATTKGNYIKNVVVTTTMGPSVKISA